MGDRETAWDLIRASIAVGNPVRTEHGLRYTVMPPVGQTVILFGKTLLLEPDTSVRE